MFIMKQKSPAPSRSSLSALPLVLGSDSLALDCVQRASLLLLEVKTGTGVLGASISSTAGVVFFFYEAFASLSSSLGRLLLYAVGHFEKRINVPPELRVSNIFLQLLRSFHGINQYKICFISTIRTRF